MRTRYELNYLELEMQQSQFFLIDNDDTCILPSQWASYQIRKIVGRASAEIAGNDFHAIYLNENRE